MLLAILLIVFKTGKSDFIDLESFNPDKIQPDLGNLFIIIFLLFAFIGKSAIYPLHSWVTGLSLLRLNTKIFFPLVVLPVIGLYILIRMSQFPLLNSAEFKLFIAVVGFTSAVLSGFKALIQKDIIRYALYAFIFQLGLILITIGSGNNVVAFWHLCYVLLIQLLLFLFVYFMILYSKGQRDIYDLGAVLNKNPVLMSAFIISALCFLFPLPVIYSVLSANNNTALLIVFLVFLGLILSIQWGRLFFILLNNMKRKENLKNIPTLPTGIMLLFVIFSICALIVLTIGLLYPFFQTNLLLIFLHPIFPKSNMVLHTFDNVLPLIFAYIGLVFLVIFILYYVYYKHPASKSSKRSMSTGITEIAKVRFNGINDFLDNYFSYFILESFLKRVIMGMGDAFKVYLEVKLFAFLKKVAVSFTQFLGNVFTKIHTGNIRDYNFCLILGSVIVLVVLFIKIMLKMF
jgi:NADH:ubiquinone oxidoreductase subunit 5 (subunit L)/multisubunit Na+/H+ antiporter MnhA subunit